MLSTTAMLATFIAMTVSFERLREAKNHHVKDGAAGIAALFFFFAYSPAYNLGNNALTYSMFSFLPFPSIFAFVAKDGASWLTMFSSLPH